MKIFIQSNFVIPGLEDNERLEIKRPSITLREFLEEVASLSPDPFEIVQQGADRLDPDDWEVDINQIPYQDYPEGLDRKLIDGDSVNIRILAQGGG